MRRFGRSKVFIQDIPFVACYTRERVYYKRALVRAAGEVESRKGRRKKRVEVVE